MPNASEYPIFVIVKGSLLLSCLVVMATKFGDAINRTFISDTAFRDILSYPVILYYRF